jgi:hypothetical protein
LSAVVDVFFSWLYMGRLVVAYFSLRCRMEFYQISCWIVLTLIYRYGIPQDEKGSPVYTNTGHYLVLMLVANMKKLGTDNAAAMAVFDVTNRRAFDLYYHVAILPKELKH